MSTLESEGLEIHPNMVRALSLLADVYRLQGRKKEAAVMCKKVNNLVPQVFPKDHPDYKKYME
jgi:cytochrome c-type biogenesis protein CcmH/NrfG